MTQDFIYLNVPGLLTRYSNPSKNWREKVLSLADTQIAFFFKHALLNRSGPNAFPPTEQVILRFSDFTPEGQAFLKSQAIEQWLASCDRKGNIEAYRDPSPLEARLAKFRRRSIQ